MEEIVRALVGFRSISGDHKAAREGLQYVADFAKQRGLHIRWYESNGFPSLVATTAPNDHRPEVMLLGHIDTVPAADEMFTLQVVDGTYKGRGVYDMKSGIAAFLQVIDSLKGQLDQYSLGLMVTSDEEIGGSNGARYLVEEQGYRPKVCIIPDGGDNWRIETFEKGVQWLKLEAKGIAGHVSRPWEGEHAVHKLLTALAEIRGFFPLDAHDKATLLSVGTIKGGETANQLADYAESVLDIRTGSVADHERTIPLISRICKDHDIMLSVLANEPPCANSLKNPFIATFKDLLVKTTGGWNGEAYSYAVTDGRFFAAHGIPCIITMPPGGGWHGTEEWVSIAGCHQYAHIVLQYVQQVALVTNRNKKEFATTRRPATLAHQTYKEAPA